MGPLQQTTLPQILYLPEEIVFEISIHDSGKQPQPGSQLSLEELLCGVNESFV